MKKKYSNPYLTFGAFHLPFEEGFQLIKNKIPGKHQDVTCRSKSIIGKLVDKSIVLDNCR